MGISKVVAANAALLLGVSFAIRRRVFPAVLLPLVHSSVVGFLVAVSAHPVFNNPYLFRKRKNGDFPWWSCSVFYPYMLPAKGYVLMRRKRTNEPVYNKVYEGIYVGGFPFLPEDVPPGQPAIVDCTCELARSACVKGLPYLCIPTWDSRGPRADDIDLAVQWATLRMEEKRPIFIHCAFGHGRSVAVTCALLVSLGLAGTWKDGEKLVKGSRPRAGLNRLQIESLEIWTKQRKLE